MGSSTLGEAQIRGKSLAAIAKDIADGYVSLNPIILKKFDQDAYKALHQQIRQRQMEARAEKFPTNDIPGIRKRNLRMQRLHAAMFILEQSARERRISLV